MNSEDPPDADTDALFVPIINQGEGDAGEAAVPSQPIPITQASPQRDQDTIAALILAAQNAQQNTPHDAVVAREAAAERRRTYALAAEAANPSPANSAPATEATAAPAANSEPAAPIAAPAANSEPAAITAPAANSEHATATTTTEPATTGANSAPAVEPATAAGTAATAVQQQDASSSSAQGLTTNADSPSIIQRVIRGSNTNFYPPNQDPKVYQSSTSLMSSEIIFPDIFDPAYQDFWKPFVTHYRSIGVEGLDQAVECFSDLVKYYFGLKYYDNNDDIEPTMSDSYNASMMQPAVEAGFLKKQLLQTPTGKSIGGGGGGGGYGGGGDDDGWGDDDVSDEEGDEEEGAEDCNTSVNNGNSRYDT
jgi:hypothetical protein